MDELHKKAAWTALAVVVLAQTLFLGCGTGRKVVRATPDLARRASFDPRPFPDDLGDEAVLWIDYDQDGDADLLVGRWLDQSPCALSGLRYQAGKLELEPRWCQPDGVVNGAVAFDYDRDGWTDILATGGEGGEPRLILNVLGDGSKAVDWPLPRKSFGFGSSISIADIDMNGDLDVFMGDIHGSSGIFLQTSTGFVEHTGHGIPGGMAIGHHHFADLDQDGDPDVAIAANRLLAGRPQSSPAGIFMNDGRGRFEAASIVSAAGAVPTSTEGVICLDYDGDGDLDILMTAFAIQEQNLLLENMGHGLFIDRSELLPDSEGISTVGASAADLDNDGWIDVVLANFRGPDSILWNLEGRRFVEEEIAVSGAASIIVHSADPDSDGQVDFFVARRSPGLDTLYRNQVTDRHWVGFRPDRDTAPEEILGWGVAIEACGSRQIREFSSGNGYGNDEFFAHFGLGSCAGPVLVELRKGGDVVYRRSLDADVYHPLPSLATSRRSGK